MTKLVREISLFSETVPENAGRMVMLRYPELSHCLKRQCFVTICGTPGINAHAVASTPSVAGTAKEFSLTRHSVKCTAGIKTVQDANTPARFFFVLF